MTPQQLKTLKECIDEVKMLAILTSGKDSVEMQDLANYMEAVYRDRASAANVD